MTDLIDQLQNIRQQLTEEKRSLQARIALIDKALAGQVSPSPKKEAAPKGAHSKGTLTDAILEAAATPTTIKELQGVLASYPPKSVDATVRQLAATGRLAKDDQVPRRFQRAV